MREEVLMTNNLFDLQSLIELFQENFVKVSRSLLIALNPDNVILEELRQILFLATEQHSLVKLENLRLP